MRLRISVLFFFTVVLLLPHSISAQTSSSNRGASIHGTVIDPEGRPVPDADVTLLGAMTVSSETRADAQGVFRFTGLSSGDYTLVANVPGFSSVARDIRVTADADVPADLHLKLSAVEDKVVVSASLGGALAPEIGSSLTVITAAQIANQGTATVADALRSVPGVDVNRGGQLGAITSVFVRGGNSDYNLVLWDGIPMNDFGGGFDFAPLPTDGVQQIEVLRGPQSALYGVNAVAGAINIVTVPAEGEAHFSFLGEGGSNEYYRLATSGSGSFHGFGWSYDFARLADTGPVIDDSYSNNTSFVTLSYSRSPRRKIIAHFFGDAGAALNPGPWGSDPDGLYPGIGAFGETTDQHQNLFGYQISETEQVSNSFRQVSTVSVSTDRDFFPSPFGNSFSNNQRLAANTRSEITISQKNVFVAGFEYDRESFKDTFVTDEAADEGFFTLPRNTYAFFAEDRWNPGSRWFLSAGVRVDVIATGAIAADEDGAGRPFIPANTITKADPRLSAAYVAHQSDEGIFGITRLHSSFGTGIRAANGFELAFTNNPDLKPEKNISGDAGIEQRFAHDRAVLDVTYFDNGYRDQVISIGSLPIKFPFITGNLSKSRAYGIETSLRVRPMRSLELTAQYTWLNTAILAINGTLAAETPFTVGQPLERRPRSSASYDATWTWKRLMLNSNASIRGPVLDIEPNDGAFACVLDLPCLFRNKGYVDANAGFSFRMPLGASIYGHVNNFLNQHYEESFGFPALRLNFVSGIKWEIPSRR